MKDNLVFGVLMSALFLGIVGSSLINGLQSPAVMATAHRYAQTLRLVSPANAQPIHVVASLQGGRAGEPAAPAQATQMK